MNSNITKLCYYSSAPPLVLLSRYIYPPCPLRIVRLFPVARPYNSPPNYYSLAAVFFLLSCTATATYLNNITLVSHAFVFVCFFSLSVLQYCTWYSPPSRIPPLRGGGLTGCVRVKKINEKKRISLQLSAAGHRGFSIASAETKKANEKKRKKILITARPLHSIVSTDF